MAAANGEVIKQQIISKLNALSEEMLIEVSRYLDKLIYDVETTQLTRETPYAPVALGGLFVGAPDLSKEEIDALRREMWCGSEEPGP